MRLRAFKLLPIVSWLLTGFFLHASNAEPEYGFPVVVSYGAEQIGSDPLIGCALQASDGTLYFGGRGLITFDGDRWQSITATGVDAVRSLDLAANGRVWVASNAQAGWFEKNQQGVWSFHALSPYIPSDIGLRGNVSAILSDEKGAIFVSSDRAYAWDGTSIKSWSLPDFDGRGARSFPVNGGLWAQAYGSPVVRVTDAGPHPLDLDFGTSAKVMLLWVDPSETQRLYGTAESIYFQDGRSTIQFPQSTFDLLRSSALVSVTRLNDGRFVLSTTKLGIIITAADGTVLRSYGSSEGVMPSVNRTFVDRDGALWAMSSLGVERIHLDKNTRVFDERSGLPSRPYSMAVKTPSGVAFANTEGIWTLDGDHRHFSHLANAPSAIYDFAALQDGFAAAGPYGLWRIRGDSQSYRIAKFAQNATCVAVSRLHPSEIFVADLGGSISVASDDQESREIIRKVPSLPSSLAEDDAGRVWIGTYTQGVYFAQRSPNTISVPEKAGDQVGLPPISSQSFVQASRRGDILVVTGNGGWIKRVGESKFVEIRDFPKRPVAAISQELPDGTFWVAHSTSSTSAPCVAQLSGTGGWHWTPHSIPNLDVIGPLRSLVVEADDLSHPVLWVGGSKAVLRHVVTDGPVAPQPRSPLLRAYALSESGERRAITGPLPYSIPGIEFEFAEPDSNHRAQLRLQTRITGIDSDWVALGKDSRRDLTAVRDGNYTLQVRAVAETGVTSEPTVFSFEVAPPWWRTRAAVWTEILALALLVWGAVQWRVLSLRRRNVQLEQKVKERTEELAEASAAKTQFVANMSHDIRNPLNGIVGLTLALEDTPLDGQQRELVATLRECTTYLSSLVDDVLDFASIEAGRIELRTAPYIPAELLNSVVTTLKGECSARGAFVTIETDPDIPPMLLGDAGRIQQILVNYVSNALKYAGGHIRVSASVSPSAPGEVEFAVTDEGHGISEPEQATLFTKFSRLQSARRNHIKGTGLGLAACRLLADLMGGAVGVESQVGQGSRFYLRLPLVAASEPVVAQDDLTLPPTTVLLVEDTDYNALAAKAVLAKLGLTCDRASTGEEAVRLFSEKRHHIVLLDRNLPDMDGTEVARRLREFETDGLHSVLLAVTAYCTAEDRQLCLDAGMDAFVGKPLTPAKLRGVLLGAATQMLGTGTVAAAPAPVVTEPPASRNAPPLDTTLLEYLAEGTQGGVAAQAERFLSELAEANNALLATTTDTNADGIGDAAHRVLGHARMIGAVRLTEVLIQLETAARKGDRIEVERTLPLVEREVDTVKEALRHHPAVQRA